MIHVAHPNRAVRRALEQAARRDARRTVRELAGGPFSTTNTGARLTVNILLRQPQTISRDLVNVILQRGGFLADKLLVRGSAEQVAGGSMQYQRSGSSYLERDVEEIAEDGDWPRSGWSEELRQEAVHQYGLEVPISGLSIRRNQVDQVTRAERRLANQIVKFVDTKAMELLTTDPDIQPLPVATPWTDPAADVIGDTAEGQEMMDVLDEGLNGSVLVVNKAMRKSLIANADLRDALKTTNGSESVRTGQVSGFLGLDNIYFTNQIAVDEGLIIDPGVAGTIADETPDPAEGWQAYNPGGGFAPIYVMVYDEKRPKRKIIAGGRWPAMALVEPRAVIHLTGLNS